MILSNHRADEKQIVAPQEATPPPTNKITLAVGDMTSMANPGENASRYLFCGHSSGLLSTVGEERDTGRDRWLGQDRNTETWLSHLNQEHRHGDRQTAAGLMPWRG